MPSLFPDSKRHRPFGAILLAAAATLALSAGPGLAGEDPAGGDAAGGSDLASAGLVGRMGSYRTAYEDTLHEVARRFDLGFVELVAANPGVDPWLPGDGTEVILPTANLLPNAPREGVVINLAEMRLYHFAEPDAVPESHPIAIGREGRDTPLGETRVVRKAEDPTWYPTKATRAESPDLPAVVPPGPDNPLGQYALYLGWPAYLIHGTNKPWGIGRQASSGCIRLYPEDIERLFAKVSVGTPVTVVDQPVKAGWIDGELYLEIHPTDGQAAQLELEGTFEPADSDRAVANLVARIRQAAGPEADRLDVGKILQAARERRGYPVQVTR